MPTPQDLNTLKQAVIQDLIAYVDADEQTYRNTLKRLLSVRLFESGLSLTERRQLFDDIYNRTRGLDILQPLMDDPDVSEVMVNGPNAIFYEKHGQLHQSALAFDDVQHLEHLVMNLFSSVNRQLSLSTPIADARLPDGTRANAVLPPLAPDGPVLTLRKFTNIRHTPESLMQADFVSAEALDFLKQAVEDKHSLFICGGTGTGKTTLLNALSHFIPPDERLLLIEDAAELQMPERDNMVRLEARQPSLQQPGIGIDALLKTALRMRPDRIIIGEVRGREAADLLHAMNTGHPGALCTGHGNTCMDMFDRLCNLILEHTRLPLEALRQTLAACIDVMVHISRGSDGQRYIDDIATVHAPRNQPPYLVHRFTRTDSTLPLEAHHDLSQQIPL